MKNILVVALFAILVTAVGSNAQTLGISIIPSNDKEVIVANFPAPADRRFVIFEAILPVRSAAECMASRDFTNAVPVNDDRAVTVFDPTTATWFLRNTTTPGSAEVCSVLLVKSSVDTTDFTMWRARFGQALLMEESGFGDKANAKDAKPQRSMVTSVAVTFSVLNL